MFSATMQRFRIAEDGYPYFLSASIVKWLPVFVTRATCDIVVDSLKFCRAEKGLRVHAYVVMPSHIHLIASTEGDLSTVLRDFKRFTARQIATLFEKVPHPPFRNVFRFCGKENRPPTEHKVWQDGNHPEIIKTKPFFDEKINYIHMNPVRKGLVTDPTAWTYSSAACYHDLSVGEGPFQIDPIDW